MRGGGREEEMESLGNERLVLLSYTSQRERGRGREEKNGRRRERKERREKEGERGRDMRIRMTMKGHLGGLIC